MTAIDASRILEPVAADQPCGVDLEYDADFLAMMQASTPKPERQMGNEVIAAEEPNWRDVKQLAVSLMARSKDLRVAVPLCRALLHTDGIVAFAQSLAVLRSLLEQFWPGLFPQLDAEDDNDPTMRVNALLGLCDQGGLLKSLREVPLVQARAAGSFGLREIEAAAGRATMAGTPPTPELIRAAFQEVDSSALETTLASLQQAREQLRGIDGWLTEQLGSMAPDLRPLGNTLASQARELEQQLVARGSTLVPSTSSAPEQADQPGASMQTPATSSAAPAGIRNRNDVVQWLDRICDFYAQNEPSSPVPLLLQRARRLVNKSFLDVVRDLVPDGLNQAELYRGRQEES